MASKVPQELFGFFNLRCTHGHSKHDVIVPVYPVYTHQQMFKKSFEFGYDYSTTMSTRIHTKFLHDLPLLFRPLITWMRFSVIVVTRTSLYGLFSLFALGKLFNTYSRSKQRTLLSFQYFRRENPTLNMQLKIIWACFVLFFLTGLYFSYDRHHHQYRDRCHYS